jgi:hypothetical protein
MTFIGLVILEENILRFSLYSCTSTFDPFLWPHPTKANSNLLCVRKLQSSFNFSGPLVLKKRNFKDHLIRMYNFESIFNKFDPTNVIFNNFSYFNFLVLGITEETKFVEMRILCIKIDIVSVLHHNGWKKMNLGYIKKLSCKFELFWFSGSRKIFDIHVRVYFHVKL